LDEADPPKRWHLALCRRRGIVNHAASEVTFGECDPAAARPASYLLRLPMLTLDGHVRCQWPDNITFRHRAPVYLQSRRQARRRRSTAFRYGAIGINRMKYAEPGPCAKP
jgi:hypothetical protein